MQASRVTLAIVACLAVLGCGTAQGGTGSGVAGDPGSGAEAGDPTTSRGPGSVSEPGGGPTPASGPEATAPDPSPRASRSGTNAWRLDRPGYGGQIAGYTTQASGPPGTRLGIKVSTGAPSYGVSAYRIGAYDGGWGSLVWRSGPQPGKTQPESVLRPVETRTVVAPWRRSLTVDTSGWEPGYYAFKLRSSTGWDTLMPYVVSSESAEGTVALVAPITTWQAYNRWGGYSLYEGLDGDRRSFAVSFDRPYGGTTGANDFRTAALPIVVRAEQLGIPLSYFTNVDIHARPGVLSGADGYVSMGHDEYWTTTMRREVMSARDAGTNLAFLGANTMYWRVRLEDRPTGADRVVVGYRDDALIDPLRDELPEEATARFRDPPAARPENDLIGMRYECYPVDADYVVVSPRWWGFRDTGFDHGDRVPGLIGPEADRVYPGKQTPRPLQVLSHTSYDCRGVTTSAQSVYYTTPSGAGVFTAGTLRWGCALIDKCEYTLGKRAASFVRVVTGNLLRGFAKGPVGERHPARDNVEDFDLPAANLVSAS
ncbi:MAG TPA: N,N-dimethylformamidase beta subunit family domain-containing protein [Nocardioides sp.]|nr:N,N-dimethylformamidase beta subunit family domain-containing protein [Nocardioides sp.]